MCQIHCSKHIDVDIVSFGTSFVFSWRFHKGAFMALRGAIERGNVVGGRSLVFVHIAPHFDVSRFACFPWLFLWSWACVLMARHGVHSGLCALIPIVLFLRHGVCLVPFVVCPSVSSHPHKIHLARGSPSMQDVVKTLSQDAVHDSVSKSGERGIVCTTG